MGGGNRCHVTTLRLSHEEINALFPVKGVRIYKHALVLCRCSNLDHPIARVRGTRKRITAVSQRSLNKLILTVGNSNVMFQSLMLVTYGPNYPLNGRKVKDDLNKFITYMKRSFGTFDYFWYLEFQGRGAPHIHFGVSLPSPDSCQRELMATIWANIAERGNWPYTAIDSPYGKKNARFGLSTRDSVFRQHRRVRNWEKVRTPDGAIRYAIKYALKKGQKVVPKGYSNVGRFWGTSEGVQLPFAQEYPVTEDEVRSMIKWLGRNLDNWQVLPKIVFHSGNLPKDLV